MNNEYLSQEIEKIRELLQQEMAKNEEVYITINDGRIKVNNALSKITGVYRNFVSFTSYVNNYNQSFTIKLVDFMTGKAVINKEKM